MSDDIDFGLFAPEEVAEEGTALRALSAPIPLSSEQLAARYDGITHDTIHSRVMVFEDEDSPNADGSPRIEVMIGTGKIGDKENPAELKILRE